MNRELTAIMNPQLGEDVLHASNLVKEGLQEIILQSLSETGFFNHALFHGGTCLRILHGLDRFSEDLDFTLREKNLDFDLEPYLDSIVSKMKGFGLEATASARRPKGEMRVYSAKIKLNLHDVLETSGFDKDIVRSSHSKALVVVKIDVDLDPRRREDIPSAVQREDGASARPLRREDVGRAVPPLGQPRQGQGHVRLQVVHRARDINRHQVPRVPDGQEVQPDRQHRSR